MAEELRAQLARRRMSGRELARQLGCDQMYISRRLSGNVEFAAGDLQAIAALLDVPVGLFFGEVAA